MNRNKLIILSFARWTCLTGIVIHISVPLIYSVPEQIWKLFGKTSTTSPSPSPSILPPLGIAEAHLKEKEASPPPIENTPKPTIDDIIQRAAERYRVDSALIKAIIHAESGYNPKAISSAGAKGLMQLMPRTAQELGVTDIFDPEENINAGVRYFRKLLDKFGGNAELALAAYNAGSRRVMEFGGVPPFKATIIYIKKVSEYYAMVRDQEKQ